MPDACFTVARAPVVVIGTARWSSPWLTEQNLAFALADRHPVLYVEPPGLDPRRRDEEGRPRLRRERSSGREVIVFSPVVLPKRSRALSGLASAPLYRVQVRALVSRLGLGGGIVLSGDARPGFVGAAGERFSSYIVKDWVYDDAQLLGRSAADLIRERDRTCTEVDLVLAISPSLQRSLASAGIASRVLRHGFHADLAGAYRAPSPAEYETLPGPRIVFAGRIDGRLDVAKLRAVARRLPQASVILIGPVSPRMPTADLAALQAQPNIQLLGERERHALPPYLAHADCLLIPYRDSVWSHHGSPLKLWDYLYAGPPVVGSGYSILKEYRPLLRFSDDDERFAEEVTSALADAGDGADRRDCALRNTWDVRAREFEAIVAAASGEGEQSTAGASGS